MNYKDNSNIDDIEQLSYVLPVESCYLLPEEIREIVVKYKENNEVLIT